MRLKMLRLLLIFFAILAIFNVGLALVLRSGLFKDFVRDASSKIVTTITNQPFTIGSIEGNFLSGFTLKDVSFTVDGDSFVEVKSASINYSLPLLLDSSMLINKVVPISAINANGVLIRLNKHKDGSWNYQRLAIDHKKEKPKEKPVWSYFVDRLRIEDIRLEIIDDSKPDTLALNAGELLFSLKLIKTNEQIELNLLNASLDAFFNSLDISNVHANAISGRAVYTDDRIMIKNLRGKVNDSDVRVVGDIHDLKTPKFNFDGSVREYKIYDIGVFNADFEGRGSYKEPNDIKIDATLSVLDSRLMGNKVSGEVGRFRMDTEELIFENSQLSSELGTIDISGKVLLSELFNKGKSNDYKFDIKLSDLQTTEFVNILENRSIWIAPEFLNRELDTLLNGFLDLSGSWKKNGQQNYRAELREVKLATTDRGNLTLNGPVEVTNQSANIDLNVGIENIDVAAITNDDNYKSDLNAAFKVKASGPLTEEILTLSTINLEGELKPSALPNLNINGATINAAYSDNVLRINNLSIDSDSLNLKAKDRAASPRNMNIGYELDVKDISSIEFLNPEVDLGGELQLSGTIQNNFINPKISAKGSIKDFLFKNHGFKAKTVNLNGQTNIDPRDLKLDLSAEVIDASWNKRPIKKASLRAASKGAGIDIQVDVNETKKRNYSASATLKDITQENKELSINTLTLDIHKNIMKNKRPITLVFDNTGARLDSFNLYHKNNFITGDATVGYNEQVDADIVVNELSLLDLSEIFDFNPKLHGDVSGSVNLTGTLDKPLVESSLAAQNLEYLNFKSDRIDFNIGSRHKELDLKLSVTHKDEKLLLIAGTLSHNINLKEVDKGLENATFTLSANSPGVDISPLAAFNSELLKIDGNLHLDIDASGKLMSPSVEGKLMVSDVTMKLFSLRNKVKIPKAVLNFNGDSGVLEPVAIETGGGEGTFTGRVNLRDLTYSGEGVMKGLLAKANPDDVTMNLDGEVAVEGKWLKSYIKGDITATNIHAIVPEGPIKEIENIHFVDGNIEDEEFIITDVRPPDHFTENVAMDIAVNVPRDSWVKGAGVDIEVEGKLDITKKYGDPYLVSGNIDVVRGDYQFMGKLFRIEGGTVSFRGKDIIDPFLDIRALYEVSSVDVFINITGTAEKPKIQLSSDPPLDETEIVSYLVFGTSSENLGTDERASLQEKAGEFLGTMAVDEIREIFGDEFALDVITIKGGQTGFRDTHMEVGKYITEDLYVGYERFSYERFFYERYFFSPGVPQSTVTANRAVIEFRVFDFLTLESEIGEESGADVFFNFNY